MASVTHQPIGTNRAAAAAVNHQLPTRFTFQPASRICTAGSVNPRISASNWLGVGLPAKAPTQAEKAAAMPASGWRPAAAKATPARGISTTKPLSAAWLLSRPSRMMTGASRRLGVWRTRPRMAALSRPTRSATPAPSMTSRTMPSGGKLVRVLGISTISWRRFSGLSRLSAIIVSPVTGLTTDRPRPAQMTLAMTRAPISQTKMKTGSGSLSPRRSTPSRNRRASGRLLITMISAWDAREGNPSPARREKVAA